MSAPTIPAWLLRGWQRCVAPAASTDEAMPALQCVQIVARGGRIRAHATDSYRIHQADAAYDGEPFSVLVPARWLAAIDLGDVKPHDPIAMSVVDNALAVAFNRQTWAIDHEHDTEYPDVQALVDQAPAPDEQASAFNPAYIADVFAAAAAWYDGGDVPALVKMQTLNGARSCRFEAVRCGDSDAVLRVVLMPVRAA